MRPVKGPPPTLCAWLFDLDGTLMDTDDQAVARLARRLGPLGSTRARRLARHMVMSAESPLNLALTLADVVGLDPWVFALRRRLSRQVTPTFRLIPGVRPLLESLATQHPLGVVSTRSRDDAEAFVAQHGLEKLFAVIVTQESTRRLKPHREPIDFAAQALGVAPVECAMVGDTTVDVRAARSAGAWAVAVLCGFGERRELARAGAHLILPSTGDLLAWLEG